MRLPGGPRRQKWPEPRRRTTADALSSPTKTPRPKKLWNVEYITAERSKETVKNISEEDDEESNIDDAFDVVGWKKGPTELGLLAALTASPPSV